MAVSEFAADAGSEHAPATREPFGDVLRRNVATLSMLAVTVVLALVFGLTTDAFFSVPNLLNVLRQVAPLLVIAVGMTFVITTGQIDLSVGSTLAFVSATSAVLLEAGWDSSIVIVIGLLAGSLIGAINGWFAAYQGIPSFIVTLAALSFVRGFALLMTGGFSVPIDSDLFFIQLGRGQVFGVSSLALIALATAIVGAVVLSRMRFGQYVTGIGANEESVRRAGVGTRRIKLAVLVLSGALAAVAGMMTAARLGSGSANSGIAFELTVIAAVVLGGTDLFGGRGTILGTVIGAFLITMVGNGLILLGMSPFLTPIVTGLILLLALWVNERGFSGLTGQSRR